VRGARATLTAWNWRAQRLYLSGRGHHAGNSSNSDAVGKVLGSSSGAPADDARDHFTIVPDAIPSGDDLTIGSPRKAAPILLTRLGSRTDGQHETAARLAPACPEMKAFGRPDRLPCRDAGSRVRQLGEPPAVDRRREGR
jgi:hypothetical protein